MRKRSVIWRRMLVAAQSRLGTTAATSLPINRIPPRPLPPQDPRFRTTLPHLPHFHVSPPRTVSLSNSLTARDAARSDISDAHCTWCMSPPVLHKLQAHALHCVCVLSELLESADQSSRKETGRRKGEMLHPLAEQWTSLKRGGLP